MADLTPEQEKLQDEFYDLVREWVSAGGDPKAQGENAKRAEAIIALMPEGMREELRKNRADQIAQAAAATREHEAFLQNEEALKTAEYNRATREHEAFLQNQAAAAPAVPDAFIRDVKAAPAGLPAEALMDKARAPEPAPAKMDAIDVGLTVGVTGMTAGANLVVDGLAHVLGADKEWGAIKKGLSDVVHNAVSGVFEVFNPSTSPKNETTMFRGGGKEGEGR